MRPHSSRYGIDWKDDRNIHCCQHAYAAGAYGATENPSFTLAQYEVFMVQQANAYFSWAKYVHADTIIQMS
jgi:hypothetical protein